MHFGPDPGHAVPKVVELPYGNGSTGLVMVFGRANVIRLDCVVAVAVTSARIRCDCVAVPAAGLPVLILFHRFQSCSLHPIASYQCSGKLVSLGLGLGAMQSSLRGNREASHVYQPKNIGGKSTGNKKHLWAANSYENLRGRKLCSALKKLSHLVRLPRSL